MSGLFVTADGFQKKTEAELVVFYENAFKGIFGVEIDLSPDGAVGQLVAFLAKRDADLWEAAQEIYTARNPNEATGISLDNISSETGVRRIDATQTQVDDVLLYGAVGTVIQLGRQASQPGGIGVCSLVSNVTLSLSLAREVQLIPNDTTPGVVVSFTLDAEPISYTVQGGDAETDIIDGLVSSIGGSTFTGTAENVNGEYLRVYLPGDDFQVAAIANLDISTIASAGTFLAVEEGVVPIPASTLNEIVTPVTGWDSVINPSAGLTGREAETDAELRIRRAVEFLTGRGTEEAIIQNLLNNVEGVQAVTVTSNRTDVVDGEGLPPHSFETVIEGGIDADVANEIWISMPAGIQPFGDDTVAITDSQGRSQDISFSRPVSEYVHVKVRRAIYSEETYPVDGDDQIKQAIVDWSLTEFNMGVDVIYQRIGIPVYTVPGVGSIEITVDSTPNPGDTPTYAAANIPIANKEIAMFDTSRIVVEAL